MVDQEADRPAGWKRVFDVSGSPMMANLLSILALALSVAVGLRQCSYQKDLDYQNLASEHLPKLCLAEKPHVRSARFISESLSAQKLDSIAKGSITGIPQDTLCFHAALSCSLRLVNVGNASAKISCISYTDTLSWLPLLRQRALEPSDRKSLGSVEEKAMEILPGDTTTEIVEWEVACGDSVQFILHMLILYENEFGNLFDTYVWSRFSFRMPISEFLMPVPPPGPRLYRTVIEPRPAERFIWPSEKDINSTQVYSRDDAAQMRSALQRAAKNLARIGKS